MAKEVKLADIAKRVGVSNVTVSKALSNKSGVSEQMRVRIKELAKEMGYIPVSVTKSNPKVGTGNIGVLIPFRFLEKNISFYWEMYQHVVMNLARRGYYGILEILNQEDEEALRLPKIIQDHKIDGLIVIGQTFNKYFEYLKEADIVPTMFLDFYDSHSDYDTIISDGYYGMYILTDYLIKMGHTEIGFVGTPFSTSSITDRYFGYMKALIENNIPVREEWVIPDRDKESNIYHDFTLPDNLPTAFACNCDKVANAVIIKLTERGLSVPDDISIVGFDNYFEGGYNIQITTYEVEIEKMAELCVRTIIRKINHKDYSKGVQIISGHMIEKESVRRR